MADEFSSPMLDHLVVASRGGGSFLNGAEVPGEWAGLAQGAVLSGMSTGRRLACRIGAGRACGPVACASTEHRVAAD